MKKKTIPLLQVRGAYPMSELPSTFTTACSVSSLCRAVLPVEACEKVTSDLVVVIFDHHLIQTSHDFVFI